jgi:hypothetical protein
MKFAGLRKRISAALDIDPSILVDRKELENTRGFSLDHFAALGLSKSDVKKLARNGLAVCGYVYRSNQYGKRDGFEARYVLVADRSES